MSGFVLDGFDVDAIVASHLKKYGYVDINGDSRLRQVCSTSYGSCRLHQRLGEQCLPVCLGNVLAQVHSCNTDNNALFKQMETLCHIAVYYPGAKKLSAYFAQLLPLCVRLLSEGERSNSTHAKWRTLCARRRRIGATLMHTMLLAGGCPEHAVAVCESGAIPVLGRILARRQDSLWCPYRDKLLLIHLLQMVVQIGDDSCWQCVRKIERELSEVWRRHKEATPGDIQYKLQQAVAGLLLSLRRDKEPSQATKNRRHNCKLQYFQFGIVCSSPQCSSVEVGRKFKMCASCGLARYCSTKCQTHHWGHGHKPDCTAMVAFDKANVTRIV